MKSLKDKRIFMSETFRNNKLISEVYHFKEVDIKQAVLRFENILKEFKNMSKIDNYEGGIEEFKNDIISLFIKKHKQIFGDWEK